MPKKSPRDSLKQFSTDELLAEIVRRRNSEAVSRPKAWCEDCAHFVPSMDINCGDDYNPCSKGHVMQFHSPEDVHFDEYGFYRTVCQDREPIPEPINSLPVKTKPRLGVVR